MLANFEEIRIVQGDTYFADINVTGLDTDQSVEKMLFSSDFLGFCKELTGSGSHWELEITAEETEGFKVGRGTFDMTVTMSGNAVATVIYNSPLEILPKTNKCK